jgi:hypothetical protein
MLEYGVHCWGLAVNVLKWFRPDIDVALPGNLIESQT